MIISYLGKINSLLPYCSSIMEKISLEIQSYNMFICSLEDIKEGIMLSISIRDQESKIWISCKKNNQNEYIHPLSAGLDTYNFMLAAQSTEIIKVFIEEIILKYINNFSAEMLMRIRELNPLLNLLKQVYKNSGTNLSNTILIFRDHLLIEKINIITSLIELGLEPNYCWIVPKEDKNLYNKEVYNEYLRLECKIFEPNDKNHNKILYAVRSLIENKKIIVVDDGGDLIAQILDQNLHLINNFTFIETTTKGMTVLERFKDIFIINLAHCIIKNNLSLNIAASCVIRFRDILRHESLIGENCLVVGYGKLGTHIATLLRALGVNVSIIEKNSYRRLFAKNEGYNCYTNIIEAVSKKKFKFIFGCSGTLSIPKEVLYFLPTNSILASCSSQDLKLVIRALEANAKKVIFEGIGDIYYLPDSSNPSFSKKITIIAHGNAVNLYYYEGVSEREYDYFTSLIFAQIVESEKGNNNIELVSTLIQKTLYEYQDNESSIR